MKGFFALLAVVAAMAALPQGARAGSLQAALHDWCFNVNGVNVTTNACNQGGVPSLPAGVVDGSNFDFTLDSSDPGYPATAASNTLGYVSVTLGAGLSQYVLGYMDYDLNYNNTASYQDYGTAVGAPGLGVSWELDDPNSSSIFTDFASNALTNTNNVAIFNGPPLVCCDVSWALGVNLDVTGSAIVTFTVSDAPPASGFYLQQTNGADTTQNIYLSASVEQFGPGPSGVPEPATLALLATGLAAVFLLRKRITA